jgi:uncharacterized damage-inducible protein DinB
MERACFRGDSPVTASRAVPLPNPYQMENTMSEDDARFPIGRYAYAARYTAAEREERIRRIGSLPERLEAAVASLTREQWDTPYRPGGWTVRQVVHHIPDSHINAYVRFKLALTEDGPAIRPYDEGAWATLADTRDTAPEVSLRLLRALHERWMVLLRSLTDRDFDRTVFHPQHGRTLTLDALLGMYAWHGDHHLAHVTGVAGPG